MKTTVYKNEDGQIVLDDPDAKAAISLVACSNLAKSKADRVRYFVARIALRELTSKDAVVVLLDADDELGGILASHLMPDTDFNALRGPAGPPLAIGIVNRDGIEDLLRVAFKIDPETVFGHVKGVVLVVVHAGIVAGFEATELGRL